MTRIRGGEHQRPHLAAPARLLIEHQPEFTEIDLQFMTRQAIHDPHRRLRHPRELRGHVTVQRAFRDEHPDTSQQLTHLAHRHIVTHPTGDLAVMPADQHPRPTMTIRLRRPHRADHPPHELIAQLTVAAITNQTQTDRSLNHPRDRLTIRPDQPRDRSIPTTIEPQPQHLTHLEHGDLPVCHTHRPPGRQTQRR